MPGAEDQGSGGQREYQTVRLVGAAPIDVRADEVATEGDGEMKVATKLERETEAPGCETWSSSSSLHIFRYKQRVETG